MPSLHWLENLKERTHSQDLGVDGNIRMYLREIQWKGVNWMHLAQDRDLGTCGGLLWTRYWTFEFHKRRGIS